jgi:CRP-like cAMP-binding protein
MSTYPNTILSNLAKSDLALLEDALSSHAFTQGQVLGETGQPIERVFFPSSGLISVVVPLRGGEVIEAGVVGRTDVFGASVALGARLHVNTGVVQMPGSALVIKAADLAAAARKSETLRHDLFLNDQFVLAQAQQSAACNARHDIPQRLATWLLRVGDRSQQEDLPLTQEFLAQMLGVQRASVSIAAGALQEAGMIKYRRGHIQIVDAARLKHVACECYAAVRAQYDRTFPARVSELA